MAGEIWLALAAACVACAAWRGARYLRQLRQARAYPARHTGEQPRVAAEHAGATEQWSPMTDIGKPPPIDARVQLANCEAQIGHWQRAADALRAQIAAEDEQRVHRALDQMERDFRHKLARAGQREIHTAEFRRSDIRRLARSGAPR